MLFLFDWQNTICSDLYWRNLPTEQSEKISELLFGEDMTFVQEWMRGERIAEEANHIVTNHLNGDYKSLWDVFVEDCKTMSVDQEILDAVQGLKYDANVVALVTDNMDSFSRFTVPALKLDRHFDSVFNSADLGRLKCDNEGQTFVEACEIFGMEPSKAVLIDDSNQSCETFKSLGGTVLQPKNPSETVVLLNRFLQSV